MSNVNFFNQLAKRANSYMNTGRMFSLNVDVYRQTFDDIHKKVHFQKDDYVLDLGGGCGQITRYIAQICKDVALADGAEMAVTFARSALKKYLNVSYYVLDMKNLPMPFQNAQFNVIICYSVIHYLDNYQEFAGLIAELLRITKNGGKIFIGDIPLSEKYQKNLFERKKYPLKNFFLNQRYYFKKHITSLLYRKNNVSTSEVKGISYTKDIIDNILGDIGDITYRFFEQDKRLPSASSREDILIQKL